MILPADNYINNIRNSQITIHTPIRIGDPNLWIPDEILENLLNRGLVGLDVSKYPIRTRSKIVKQAVCSALGYPVEETFPKLQPRFTGQNFDTYNQKSHNLQIWNEEISPQRRYVIIGISPQDLIFKVKVINGYELAKLDKTGTITKKYQASFVPSSVENLEIISPVDSTSLIPHLSDSLYNPPISTLPTMYPVSREILPIFEIYSRLKNLIGQSFTDPGRTNERLRGAMLHKLVCKSLGYSSYADDGKFPDIKHQLLEIKLQTSPTVDLGVICPDAKEASGLSIDNTIIRYCDTRYAVLYGVTDGFTVTLTHLVVSTGADFFSRFTKFQGNIINGKIQILLPHDFFN